MQNKKTILILLAAFVVLMVGAYLLYGQLGKDQEPEQLQTVQPNKPDTDQSGTGQTADTENLAPDFKVYDAQGKAVRLSDYFGKPIVLNFWASWCGPCQMEMPDFQDAFLELDGQVQFLMVNMTDGGRETVDKASAFIAQQGYTFPVFFDTGYEAATTYGVYSLPTTYFIDAQGNLIAQASGAIDAATLQKGIGMIYQAD